MPPPLAAMIARPRKDTGGLRRHADDSNSDASLLIIREGDVSVSTALDSFSYSYNNGNENVELHYHHHNHRVLDVSISMDTPFIMAS
ncbi:unnamed protein product [Linum trigynum]